MGGSRERRKWDWKERTRKGIRKEEEEEERGRGGKKEKKVLECSINNLVHPHEVFPAGRGLNLNAVEQVTWLDTMQDELNVRTGILHPGKVMLNFTHYVWNHMGMSVWLENWDTVGVAVICCHDNSFHAIVWYIMIIHTSSSLYTQQSCWSQRRLLLTPVSWILLPAAWRVSSWVCESFDIMPAHREKSLGTESIWIEGGRERES